MELYLTHKSALEYWRQYGGSPQQRQSQLRRKAPGNPPTPSVIAAAANLGLTLPLDIAVSDKGLRRPSRKIRPHVLKATLPGGSIIAIGGGLHVSSPELTFLQMAGRLSQVGLIRLGFELCGAYSLLGPSVAPGSREEARGFIDRPALTTVDGITALLTTLQGIRGMRQAARPLCYIADGSASPMETILAMLLTLPHSMGGYGLCMPELNPVITLTRSARKSASQATFTCDLFWRESRVAVEYDSDAYHTGPARITSDSKRRNSLTSAGITVITVTNQQIRSIVEFEKVARQIALKLGKRLQYQRNPKFLDAQRELRYMLF